MQNGKSLSVRLDFSWGKYFPIFHMFHPWSLEDKSIFPNPLFNQHLLPFSCHENLCILYLDFGVVSYVVRRT